MYDEDDGNFNIPAYYYQSDVGNEEVTSGDLSNVRGMSFKSLSVFQGKADPKAVPSVDSSQMKVTLANKEVTKDLIKMSTDMLALILNKPDLNVCKEMDKWDSVVISATLSPGRFLIHPQGENDQAVEFTNPAPDEGCKIISHEKQKTTDKDKGICLKDQVLLNPLVHKKKKTREPTMAQRQSARIRRDGVPISVKARQRADFKDDISEVCPKF
ncbi:hypothetical protein ABZP36_000993 [Zizania latifolia]